MSLEQVLDLRTHRDMDKLLEVARDVYEKRQNIGLLNIIQRAELSYAKWGDESDYDELIRCCIDALAF